MPLIASQNLTADGLDLISLLEKFNKFPHMQDQLESEIWEKHGQYCAVMFTDLANFSCNSKNKGIVSSLAHILEAQRKIFECVEAEGGRVIKTMGDSLIALFSCPDKALAISIQIMRSDLFQDTLTIGLGFGKLIKVGERDIFGEEVNNSSFLAEDFGKAGQLLISKAFKDSLNDINPIVFVELATTKPDIAAFEVSWG